MVEEKVTDAEIIEEGGAASATPLPEKEEPVATPGEGAVLQDELSLQIDAFNVEMQALLQKYNLSLTGEPFLLPAGDGGFRIYAKPVLFRKPSDLAPIPSGIILD